MPAGPRPVARRTALVLGAVGALAVAGCDDGDEPAATPTPDADPDDELVDAVLADLAAAEQLALAAGLPDLADLHRAHLDALEGDPPATPSPGGRAAARAAVRTEEQRLQRRLVEAAMAAESGRLARLLASMSAAVAQRLATLAAGAA